MRPSVLLCVVWLLPMAALAQSRGVALYERGEYAKARRALELDVRTKGLSHRELGIARLYLAASLHELGELAETRAHLEDLARNHPDQPVEPALFPPEFVLLASEARRRVDAERQPPPPEPKVPEVKQAPAESPWEEPTQEPAEGPEPMSAGRARLLPEVFGFVDPVGKSVGAGGGLTYGSGSFEVGARVLLGSDVGAGLQAGYVLGDGAFRPHVALRATAVPGLSAYGAGPVVGARFALGRSLTALVDVGGEFFFKVPETGYRSFALTASAGFGFDLLSP
ncbi:tetratricopeptide repeat protein [Pyxidicoccus fallax]|uniref:Tetratricopeptide repeat protein n=1 Tax=Pyxidicoccus fallax TaxID=394095 RepID=A0A848LPS3_9BACT|nr:tetratricopeptide repeat protein [Pyxidicoccus fallax]NMO19691.1 tetratricopeptide repeat protein [Pyxidicoccus fallax]NPC80136.1 tetratricopeptide repeat protein [Pyxidicoccus fallax]